jgi:hypothetical protein
MRANVAAMAAVLAIAVAVVVGALAGRVARPGSPTPVIVSRTVTPAPTSTPAPLDEATLFHEPLSGGCATSSAVWVVTNGGGILRYDGTSWSRVDTTLRALVRAACAREVAYAVGLVGSWTSRRARSGRSTCRSPTSTACPSWVTARSWSGRKGSC